MTDLSDPLGLVPEEAANDVLDAFAERMVERQSEFWSGQFHQLAEFLEDARPVRAVPADVADYRTVALGDRQPTQLVGSSLKRRRLTVYNITGTIAAPNYATLPAGVVVWISTSPTGGNGNRFPLVPGASFDHEAKTDLYAQTDLDDVGYVAIAGSEYDT